MKTPKEKLQAWRAFYEYSARAQAALECRLRSRSGLSLGEYNILLVLAEAREPLRMGQIADRIVFAPSRLTYVVGNLESRGWLSREPDPVDRRASVVTLTDLGREVFYAAAAPHLADITSLALDELTDEEADLLEDVFTRLAGRLDFKTRRCSVN
ncbi:MAG: MarR family transcriptional regulator [Buchananella hordeovulneris]|nr:MarR family transcriptional regulator [Buchananella hordeovulneris]